MIDLFALKTRRRSPRRTRRALLRICAALACAALLHQTARAGGGPESIFLIVNARGAASKEVANHYVALRHVPPSNVFYLNAPIGRAMKATDFREQILTPILAEIDKRGLTDVVDQIVYSCEFPYQINFGSPTKPAGPENREIASLTGATYLYQVIQEAPDRLAQSTTNFYFAPQAGNSTVTRAFHRRLKWSPSFVPVPENGLSYLLATQLGAKDAEGNSVPEMIKYLTRAASADGTRPPGTFYYMKNDNIRSKTRDAGFAAAVTELRALGLRAEVGIGVVPDARVQLLGLTTGSPQVVLRASGSELGPGSLVDNLTSLGALMAPSKSPNPQTRISEYLRLGAAGASGTVIEPFAIAEKFPSPSLHVHYARGCCMAEAFFQSVLSPYQLLIVGDPLCQPWARIPAVTPEGIADGQMISGQVSITPAAKLAEGQTIASYELFVDGKRVQRCAPGEKFDLDTTKLPDGYHELRIVAVDGSAIETQGRWIGEVTVKNGRDALSITSPAGARITGPQVKIAVNSTVDAAVLLWHNGREVGRVKGRSATLDVPVDKLGKGPVVITASILGSARLSSQPLRLEIQ